MCNYELRHSSRCRCNCSGRGLRLTSQLPVRLVERSPQRCSFDTTLRAQIFFVGVRIYSIVHTWYDSLFSSHTQQKEFQSRCSSRFNSPRINMGMIIWRMVQGSRGEVDRASLCDAEVDIE